MYCRCWTCNRHLPLCHLERSRGTCGSADLSWKCFSTELAETIDDFLESLSVSHSEMHRFCFLRLPDIGVGNSADQKQHECGGRILTTNQPGAERRGKDGEHRQANPSPHGPKISESSSHGRGYNVQIQQPSDNSQADK